MAVKADIAIEHEVKHFGNLSLARAAIAKALEFDRHDHNLWVLKGQIELQEVHFEAPRQLPELNTTTQEMVDFARS